MARRRRETIGACRRYGAGGAAFAAVFGELGRARAVLPGEASPGTSEFYEARAAITRRPAGRHGLAMLAVEADWPDAARLDVGIRGGRDTPLLEAALPSTFLGDGGPANAVWPKRTAKGSAPAPKRA